MLMRHVMCSASIRRMTSWAGIKVEKQKDRWRALLGGIDKAGGVHDVYEAWRRKIISYLQYLHLSSELAARTRQLLNSEERSITSNGSTASGTLCELPLDAAKAIFGERVSC